MARRSPSLWLWAAAGVGAYLLFGRGSAGGGMAPGSTWQKSPDNWMALGGLFRWTTPALGPATASQIASALAARGYTSVTVWQGSGPSDWPAEAALVGNYNRIEAVQNTGAEQWLPPSVVVYVRIHGAGHGIAAAPPTGGAELAAADDTAAIAQGYV